MSGTFAGAWVCLLAPLAGFLVILLGGNRIRRQEAGWISTLSVFIGFAGAVGALVELWQSDHGDRHHVLRAFTWLRAGDFAPGLEITVDTLAIVMMLVVTGVGGLIVLYSNGYMAGEDEQRRYFAYMSFFVFSMLVLVQAGNLLLMLVGWGLVGLASYLLIGFYHRRPDAIAAAKKAFVINAVGDALFAMGLFLLIAKTGTVDFTTAFDAAENGELTSTVAGLIALGLLGGAVAKSAQIPFHTWLPDAMEGPTPVSALIHAATMVTAGVYLICRVHPIFEAAPSIQHTAAILGLVTLLVAGLIGLAQHDIKRVIAYSTMSQIGYMFVAAGIGAYGFAMFHLVTHAFFKALLFLAAGVVIHHLDGEQDIRRMGGLRRLMPYTHAVFLIGTLALVGIPPLAGFWSKDAVLASALATGGGLGWVLYVGGLAGALLTGAYSFRLYYRVFHGPPSEHVVAHSGHGHVHEHGPEHGGAHDRHAHAGEGPGSMLWPVGILAALSVVGGLLNVAGAWHPFTHWIDETAEALVEASVAEEYITSAIAVALGLAGYLIAKRAFDGGREIVPEGTAFTVLSRKLYVDELYAALFERPLQAASATIRDAFERPVVQGSLDRIGTGAQEASTLAGRVQTGLLRSYAFAIAASVVVLGVVFLVVR
ncbi:MAG: NADH-quinone oxidoreductase subunit L [Actinobacteria bacterium]|nr:NADH-quinone oxidoreductase subunit L [Actinomycetota bacterium]